MVCLGCKSNDFLNKCSTSLSAVPNGSDVNAIILNKIIHFIGQNNQIAIGSDMCEFFVFSSQIGHGLKQVDAMYDFPNPTLGHLLTCKVAVELVNGIEFVGCSSQPMEFKRHNAHRWMSGSDSVRFDSRFQPPEVTSPSAHGYMRMAKASR